ncbi:hypothetical protein ACWDSJ_09470 [Nocardia sp. NPDC003482]
MVGRVAVGAAVVTAGMLASQGVAAADFSAVVMNCSGVGPNVVDVPYSAQVVVGQYSGRPGWTGIAVHSGASVWGGYTSRPTLTWTNLATGVSDTATGQYPVSSVFGTGGQANFDAWNIGGGPVRFDLTAVNTGLFPVPPVTCSAVIDIP